MKKITDNDLVLLYYGELDDPALVRHVASSPELSARFEALCTELDPLDSFEPPPREEDYGADVWQQISPRLEVEEVRPFSRMTAMVSALKQPRFSLAGAFSLALVAALAFMLGRQAGPQQEAVHQPEEEMLAASLAEPGGTRLLTSSISGHLDQLNLVFTQFANSSEPAETDATRATDLLVANRLYRSAAIARGNQQLAIFLSELEPLLIEMAHEAYKTSPATKDRMQQEARENLLFRVRVMTKQLDQSNIST